MKRMIMYLAEIGVYMSKRCDKAPPTRPLQEQIRCWLQTGETSPTHNGTSWMTLFLNRHLAKMDQEDHGRIDAQF